MFEDRSDKYDFAKYDKIARTVIVTENKEKEQKNESDAHKKLFNFENEIKASSSEVKQPIIETESAEPRSEINTSPYLKQFENRVVPDEETIIQNPQNETELKQPETEFVPLTNSVFDVKVNEKQIRKEIKKSSALPKKNYSFRIKLLSGVYVMLVVLFGGWVIANTINISNTSSLVNDSLAKIEEVSGEIDLLDTNIGSIVTNIHNFNNATGDKDDETLTVRIINEELELTPESVINPNEYKAESNWFDVFSDFIANIFGGN